MAKKSDVQSIATLRDEFLELRSMIVALRTDSNGAAVDKELAWLGHPDDEEDPSTLWGRRYNCFARYTYARFSWGMDASTRGESINSSARTRPTAARCAHVRQAQRAPAHRS